MGLQADSGIPDLEDGKDSSDECQDGRDDGADVGPGQTGSLDAIDDETNDHEDAGEEANYDQGQDGAVLADWVDAQVDAGQDHRQEESDQPNGHHGLSGLEPVFIPIPELLAAGARSPKAIMAILVDAPFGGREADDVENRSES